MKELMNGELPKKFKTWVEFYNSFKDKIAPDTTIVNWVDRYPDAEESHSFTLLYVKACCFDEIMEGYPKVAHYEVGYGYDTAQNAIVDIDALLGLKIRRNHWT